jgi:hypothetical protein
MDKDSKMLKCLKCRLIGHPPVFNMSPPPSLPASVLYDLQKTDPKLANFITQNLNKSQQTQSKRCLKLKSYLNIKSLKNNEQSERITSTQQNLVTPSNEFTDSSNQLQSLIFFSVCFLFFLIVLSIAFLFLYKLFKLRKKYQQKKLSINSNNINNNTMSDKLNTFNSKQKLVSLYDLANSNIITQPQQQIFYNQLFESTRQLLQQKQHPQHQSDLSTSTSTSSTLDDQHNIISIPVQQYQHYLQAVPNSSNLIENHLNYRIYHQTSNNSSNNQLSEYDEINSQSYQYDNQLFKSSSCSSSTTSSTSSTKPLIFNPMTTTIIQPIMPTMSNRHSGFLIINNNNNNNSDNSNGQSTVNELINSNFYYAC